MPRWNRRYRQSEKKVRFLRWPLCTICSICCLLYTSGEQLVLGQLLGTLTQQLAKNELFTQEKQMARKAAEMFAARDIEDYYSKQQIFEM